MITRVSNSFHSFVPKSLKFNVISERNGMKFLIRTKTEQEQKFCSFRSVSFVCSAKENFVLKAVFNSWIWHWAKHARGNDREYYNLRKAKIAKKKLREKRKSEKRKLRFDFAIVFLKAEKIWNKERMKFLLNKQNGNERNQKKHENTGTNKWIANLNDNTC